MLRRIAAQRLIAFTSLESRGIRLQHNVAQEHKVVIDTDRQASGDDKKTKKELLEMTMDKLKKKRIDSTYDDLVEISLTTDVTGIPAQAIQGWWQALGAIEAAKITSEKQYTGQVHAARIKAGSTLMTGIIGGLILYGYNKNKEKELSNKQADLDEACKMMQREREEADLYYEFNVKMEECSRRHRNYAGKSGHDEWLKCMDECEKIKSKFKAKPN